MVAISQAVFIPPTRQKAYLFEGKARRRRFVPCEVGQRSAIEVLQVPAENPKKPISESTPPKIPPPSSSTLLRQLRNPIALSSSVLRFFSALPWMAISTSAAARTSTLIWKDGKKAKEKKALEGRIHQGLQMTTGSQRRTLAGIAWLLPEEQWE